MHHCDCFAIEISVIITAAITIAILDAIPVVISVAIPFAIVIAIVAVLLTDTKISFIGSTLFVAVAPRRLDPSHVRRLRSTLVYGISLSHVTVRCGASQHCRVPKNQC